jgi:hypothetical protein
MDTHSIVEELTQQRDRLVAAIEALRGKRFYQRSASSGIKTQKSKRTARDMGLAVQITGYEEPHSSRTDARWLQ